VPLPLPNTPWPPQQLAKILPPMREWSAWYGGDVNALAAVYGGAVDPSSTEFFSSDAGGFKATIGRLKQRWFHGEPARGPERRIKLHVPIAADLCQSSADLLFADPPSLSVPKTIGSATQDRLNDFTDDDLYTTLAEGHEIGAALSGHYLRVSWAQELCDKPFLMVIDADCAIPEFKVGILTAVTFWAVVHREGRSVWRHLERHELNAEGHGIIGHFLYAGEDDNIGQPMDLMQRPETAAFVDLNHPDGVYDTESKGLAVVYIPNQRPARKWRTDPLGRYLGRSDLAGQEQMMDALDETYTSWQRDVRLGKARLHISRSMTQSNGAGSGATVNLDQEIYQPVNALLGEAKSMGDLITETQFKIRVQEHKDTARDLLENIVRSAGYSGHAFGIQQQSGGRATATEVESQERRSLLTRDRKIRLAKPAISYIVTKLLAVDKAVFGRPNLNLDEDVQVTFPDGVQESQLNLAQTALALRQAEAASTETLVALVHPDWDDDEVEKEAALILKQTGASVPPPAPFGAADEPDPLNPQDPSSAIPPAPAS
jgi:A118 family predicted phage portal protein